MKPNEVNPAVNAVPEAPPSTKPPASGHDARGRFVRGHRGGPGNPFVRRQAELRRALFAAGEDPVQLNAVVRQTIEAALAGDMAAAALVLKMTIGS